MLPASEKIWIGQRLAKMEKIQLELDRLFRRGAGEQVCQTCQGDCCAKGHNHLTLANLLGYLLDGEYLPPAEFSRTCPFLAENGCLLPASRRPYNCISFVCDRIEENLMPDEIEQFYALEQRLRSFYQEFAVRYAGAALTGLLIQDQRLEGRSFFSRKTSSVLGPGPLPQEHCHGFAF